MQSTLGRRTYTYKPSARTRLTATALSFAICIALGVMLVWMGMIGPSANRPRDKLSAVSFSADPVSKTGGKQTAAKALPAPARIVPQDVQRPPQLRLVPKPTTIPPLDLSRKTADPVTSFDLGKLPKRADGGASAGSGPSSAAAYGPGEGPGGAKLYNAEWYREPSEAEIGGYMPRGNIQPQWAMIACRTIERYHVENCQELGESPRGSGLARAMRQAAWQFLVRPPRIDGKPVIGAWVRIRFDFKARNRDDVPSGTD